VPAHHAMIKKKIDFKKEIFSYIYFIDNYIFYFSLKICG
jgi:hypothetical protein